MLLVILLSAAVLGSASYKIATHEEPKPPAPPAMEVKLCDVKVPVLFIQGQPAAVGQSGLVCPEDKPAQKAAPSEKAHKRH